MRNRLVPKSMTLTFVQRSYQGHVDHCVTLDVEYLGNRQRQKLGSKGPPMTSHTLDASRLNYIVTSWDLSPTSATEHRTEVSLYQIPHPYICITLGVFWHLLVSFGYSYGPQCRGRGGLLSSSSSFADMLDRMPKILGVRLDKSSSLFTRIHVLAT